MEWQTERAVMQGSTTVWAISVYRKNKKNEEIHGKPLPSYQKNLNVARAVRELLIEITIQRWSKSMWHFSWSISVIQSMHEISDRMVEAESNLQNEKLFSEFHLKVQWFLEFHKYIFSFLEMFCYGF